MMKPMVAPIPDSPYLIYHNPYPCQMRLWSRSLLVYRPTVTTEDMLFAYEAVRFAAYWHLEVVTLDQWRGLPGVVRAAAKDWGVKVVLCKTLKQAVNSADIREFWKAG